MGRFSLRPSYMSPFRPYILSLIFGLLALVFNLLAANLFSINELLFGNIFIFLIATSLQPLCALCCALITLIPLACIQLIDPITLIIDPITLIRIICFVLAISIVARKYQKISPDDSAIVIWTVFLCLTPFLSKYNILPEGHSESTLIIASCVEMICISIANCLLLNTDVYTFFTGHPRRIRLKQLLYYIFLTGLESFVVTIVFVDKIESYTSIALAFVLAIVAAKFFAEALSNKIVRDSEILLNNSIISSKITAFGNATKTNWTSSTTLAEALPFLQSSNKNLLGAQQNEEKGNIGICAINKEHVVLFVNKQFKEFLEINHPFPFGQQISDIGIDKKILAEIMNLISRTSLNESKSIEVKFQNKENEICFYEIKASGTNNLQAISLSEDNEGIVLKIKNISKSRVVNTNLIKNYRLKTLDNVMRNIGHSINNTFITIIGQACCGKLSDKKEEIIEYFDSIIASCQSSGDTVKRLLDFNMDRKSHIEAVDISELIRIHMDFFKHLLNELISIQYEQSANDIGAICDKQLVIQAITNLLINAKESFIHGTGSIVLRTEDEFLDDEIADLIPGGRAGKFCRITVSDNGQGMNPDVLAKCCEALYTTKDSSQHQGLGLTMVYNVMRSMDGFLSIESRVNKGTTISLYLPHTEDIVENPTTRTQSEQIKAETEDTTEKTVKKILIAEDNIDVKNILSIMLSKLGYQTSNCDNAFEALHVLKNESFDLLLTDYAMPKMNGLELITEARKIHPELNALIVTAYEINDDIRDSGVPTLQKPFDIKTLEQTLNKIFAE